MTVSGTAESFGDEEDVLFIDLILSGSTEKSYSAILAGTKGDFVVENVAPGTYTMKVYKNNHVTREYEIVVADEDIVQDVKIHLIGDINGDGKVMLNDYTSILRHVKKVKTLEGYEFACADIDSNGRIMVTDYSAVLRHVKKISSLW